MTKTAWKRWLVYFLVNHIYAGTRCFQKKRRMMNAIGHNLGEGTKLVGPVFCTGILQTGRDCWIGRNLTIHGNGQVILGNNCDVGPDVMFLTGGHLPGGPHRRAGLGITEDIHVEDSCWIGARATLLPGFRMGAGSILAACGCGVREISPNTLAGGVPAKRIRDCHEME